MLAEVAALLLHAPLQQLVARLQLRVLFSNPEIAISLRKILHGLQILSVHRQNFGQIREKRGGVVPYRLLLLEVADDREEHEELLLV